MPCITVSAAAMSVPVRLLPLSSQVKVTKIGLSLTLRTASTAARASDRVIIVSITKRSTPACSSPAACSVYISTSSSNAASPSGARKRPVGAMSPATHARPSAACLESEASSRFICAVRLKIFLSSSFWRFAPKVGEYRIFEPAATYAR